ncbi:PepSY-associated TM helix domain-containing protein [Shewanella xiamenensis]|uniref:PepSY-associated TM helix domain-containing protein n=1 Tax=Shewanella xiamenensis TaxID=332186 RepID=UPI0024A77521|nr:PepSY-associated TM helix domain-containing protein [Shewanella xiamenensis]MDI5839839.1 PepSY domain-containing protein [Shewanella xiamenensis]MDI5843495.1 PepSY domain-containing protein [Shewanella xiamenensis]MDI5849912.1 PepSY domain-containing protein [Shewanella xiamenensis]MDI5851687.1 PepSY domain-containing protein [Shewanella xiamenensis]MDI5855832.1 PepSY domain-containing protein [Shewanella xiamenensis]
MKETFFRTLSWLHTWAGLLVCWVLLLIFFAGSLSYFRHEISLWAEPELHRGTFQDYQANQLISQLDKGQHYIESHSPAETQRWLINFPTQRSPMLSFAWQLPPEKGQRRGKIEQHTALADGSGVITDVRDSRGGDFFYRLHFDLHYMPAITARYIVGVCTMFMLIALISGIVIHKRIFKDLFSFRQNKGARSWLDAHNVSSVIALPYHLMITYTGLITLMLIYIPWTVSTAYPEDNQAFLKELNPARQTEKASGIYAEQVRLSQLLPQVQAEWGNAPIKQVIVSYPQDKNSQVTFYQNTGKDVTDESTLLVFNGVTGELKYASPHEVSGTVATYDTMMSLHTARFAAPLLRILFFFCGLLGCAMVATGTLMWAIRLRQKQQKAIDKGEKPSSGLRLVEGLNFMFILGLPLGAAAFFYANRILPADFATRSAWEVHSFFIALGAMGVWAFFGRSRRDWQIALVLIGTLYCALPILNALTSPSHFIDNIQSQQWALVGFDVLAVLIGVVMLFASTKLSVVAKTLQKPNRKNTISDKKPMRKPVETTYATELTSSPLEEAKS